MPKPHSHILLFLLALIISTTSQAQSTLTMEQALAAPERDVNHFLRDETRHPLQVLDFLGITQGMRILDVYAADGYYSYILSRAVGPEGIVYAQNPAAGSNLEDVRQMYSLADALDVSIEEAQLNNIEHLRQDFFDLDISLASLDGVMLVQILHDFYNGDEAYAAALLAKLKTYLKPGGFIAVIDHAGDANQDNARLHRMQKGQVEALAVNLGFTVTGDSDLLHNDRDRRRRPVFDPMLGRNTDRFLLKLVNEP